jgi:lipopolysaccharide transport system ATP-binding protein
MTRVRAENIVVDFPIYGSSSRSLKNTVIRAATGGTLAKDAAERVVVRALDGLSFEILEGDRVGIVGHNGSGKTTLLRVIAGAYEPVRGSIEVAGRVASMLSITLGMDMEATGYENIYLRAALMGFKPKEVAPLVSEICEFSELGDYIEMPVRTYSSGMMMRLAFTISTCVSADVILMDEWLSVGDPEFREKAQRRLQNLLDQAKVLVLASNDESLIRANCNRIMRLEHGKMMGFESVRPLAADRAPQSRQVPSISQASFS